MQIKTFLDANMAAMHFLYLALPQSILTHQFSDVWLFFTPNLTEMYRTPTESTREYLLTQCMN